MSAVSEMPPRQRVRPTQRDLASAALFLGLVGFGGGLSVLSIIRSVTVEKHRWLTDREFANTATVAQMLPGGAAANTLSILGLRFGGLAGAAICYVGFCLPGTIAILGLAWVYQFYGTVPHLDFVLRGFNDAVVGILVSITLTMAKNGVARLWQAAVAAFALLLSIVGGAGAGEVVFLGIFAGLGMDLGFERARLLRYKRRVARPAPPVALPEEGHALPRAVAPDAGPDGEDEAPPPPPTRPGATPPLHAWVGPVLLAVALAVVGRDLVQMAIVFFRAGLGAYGGGFAIIPHLKAAMLQHGWVTDKQFADAVAVGKLTPGPVLLMATFLGFVHHGFAGAIVATLGVFSGPFFLTVVLSTWLDRVRARRWVRAALRGLTPSVVGLMAAACLSLGESIATDVGLTIAAGVALTMSRFDVNPVTMLVIGGAARVALHAGLGL